MPAATMPSATESVSGLTRNNTVTLSGTVFGDPGIYYGRSVTVYEKIDDYTWFSLAEVPIAANHTWSYTTSLADGTYNLIVASYAPGLELHETFYAPTLQIDTTGPSLTAGESASGITAGTGVVLSGTVSDSGGVGAVEIMDTNGATWTDLGAATISGTTWQFTAGNLKLGAHNFVAIATDSLGNYSTASAGPALTVVQNTPLWPALQRIVGNMDGGVTLLGRAAAGSTVTISDTSAGITRVLGSATVGSDSTFTMTTHTKISTAAVNTFTATVSNAAGQTGASLGLFQLSSAGSDTLSGTAGQSDVFATFLRTGQDTISGFETTRAVGMSHDVLNLSGTGYGSYSQVAPHISGTSSAVIQLDATRSITLLGVAASSLQASDFSFS